MTRPLRIDFPGAVYHITSRGNRRTAIFEDDTDASLFLKVLGEALQRFNSKVLAYCLMTNHYHLVIVTPQGGLSLLMRQINGVYSQTYNRRHGVTGHLLQGRFKAILVDHDAYLMELCRYVELNPVRAGMVAAAGDWNWSSYAAHVGKVNAPTWLDVVHLHAFVLGREIRVDAQTSDQTFEEAAAAKVQAHTQAALAYAELVASAPDVNLWADLQQQMFLGDADFIARMQALADPQLVQSNATKAATVAKPHRNSPLKWADWLERCGNRNEALLMAHRESGISMTALAAEIGVTVARVSQLIKRAEGR